MVWLGSDLILGLIMWDETQPLEHLGNVCFLDGKIGRARAGSVVGRADHKTYMSLWRGEAFSTHHLPARARAVFPSCGLSVTCLGTGGDGQHGPRCCL